RGDRLLPGRSDPHQGGTREGRDGVGRPIREGAIYRLATIPARRIGARLQDRGRGDPEGGRPGDQSRVRERRVIEIPPEGLRRSARTSRSAPRAAVTP